jgi:hypothetical protein
MKDMTKPGLEGYYYMNNFLAIKHNNRPLCVQSYRFENALQINIPITENKYSESQFLLRINSLSTFSNACDPFQIQDSVINYSVYTFNEKISEV